MMKTTRVVMKAHGGPDVMELETLDLAPPGAGEVQIAQTAIGLNYMDVYQRSGAYPLPLPSPLGLEAAGEIIAVGDGVTDLVVGDRLVYGGVLGSYASHRNAPAARCIKIPDGITITDSPARHQTTTRDTVISGSTWRAVLLILLRYQNGRAGCFAAFKRLMGRDDIRQRKTLVDVYAQHPFLHQTESFAGRMDQIFA